METSKCRLSARSGTSGTDTLQVADVGGRAALPTRLVAFFFASAFFADFSSAFFFGRLAVQIHGSRERIGELVSRICRQPRASQIQACSQQSHCLSGDARRRRSRETGAAAAMFDPLACRPIDPLACGPEDPLACRPLDPLAYRPAVLLACLPGPQGLSVCRRAAGEPFLRDYCVAAACPRVADY